METETTQTIEEEERSDNTAAMRDYIKSLTLAVNKYSNGSEVEVDYLNEKLTSFKRVVDRMSGNNKPVSYSNNYKEVMRKNANANTRRKI